MAHYGLPPRVEADLMQRSLPQWPTGIGSLPVRLDGGAQSALPVLAGVNTLTLGVTGSGKTHSFTLPAARILLSDPGRKAVFFEIKTTYVNRFFRPGDKIIAHSAAGFPAQAVFRWNMIREIRQAEDTEAEIRQISAFLFRDTLAAAGQNLTWIQAARNTFAALLRVIVDCCPSQNTGNRTLIRLLRETPLKGLLAYLSHHGRNRSLLHKVYSFDPANAGTWVPSRRAEDVMFFLHEALEQFSGTFADDGQDTIYDVLHAPRQNLFLIYDLASAEASRPFLCYFLKKIKDLKLSNRSTVAAPLLMVLDEVDKLADGGTAADFGLFQAATLGREYGVQLLLSTQSMESLYGLAPQFRDHIAHAGLAGFPAVIAFRPGDRDTIQTLQQLYGSAYRERIVYPVSRYDSPTVHCELEPLVTDAEFSRLKTGEAYVKLLECPPVKVAFSL